MIRCVAKAILAAAVFLFACGDVPPPRDAYTSAPDLMADLNALRSKVRSFRIRGRVDHFGEEHRISGQVFLFAELPAALRVELVSPFGSPLSVLTVDQNSFALHDLREGTFLEGPAEPCNIARLVRIPLPAEDVIRILIGHTPLLSGDTRVTWQKKGFYQVEIKDGDGRTQYLNIGPNKKMLPLLQSVLKDDRGEVFSLSYDRWISIGDMAVPREIRVKMQREKTDLLLRYDEDGVELNADLADDAWTQSPPPGIPVQKVTCNDQR
jgi:outer membrane biogenesis lipoprotein LolB